MAGVDAAQQTRMKKYTMLRCWWRAAGHSDDDRHHGGGVLLRHTNRREKQRQISKRQAAQCGQPADFLR